VPEAHRDASPVGHHLHGRLEDAAADQVRQRGNDRLRLRAAADAAIDGGQGIDLRAGLHRRAMLTDRPADFGLDPHPQLSASSAPQPVESPT
jgi:hypothetical protein